LRLPVRLLVLSLLAVGLTACKGELSVDLQPLLPDGVSSMVVQLDGVELLTEDGDAVDIDFSEPVALDLVDYEDEVYNIITGEDIDADSFSGIRLLLETTGNYVVDPDGYSHDVTVVDGSSFWDLNLDADEDESHTITMTLDLRLSLYEGSSGYELTPIGVAVIDDDSASLSGRVEDDIMSGTCDDDANDTAIYLFEGQGVVPDDYDQSAPDPILTASVDYDDDTSTYRYSFDAIPDGGYTLALTCTGDVENGPDDDYLSFPLSDTIDLGVGDAETLDFTG